MGCALYEALSELTARKQIIREEITSLLARRSVLSTKSETKEERTDINRHLRKLRNEVKLLDRIAETSERMRKALIKERQPERAEDRIPL